MANLHRKPIWPLIAFVLAFIALGSGYHVQAQSQAQEHHAGLVLQFADGSVKQYCLAFSGDSISGLDLLLKTGLEVKVEVYGGMGGEVCKIGQDGCDFPGQPCACQSYGVGGVYWSYHHLKDGKWQASVLGAGSYKVHDGDVDGWAWSDGKPPPLFNFEQLCALNVPAPEATKQPTHTAQPAVTATSRATRPSPIATPTRATVPTRPVRPTAVQTAQPQLNTATRVIAATSTPELPTLAPTPSHTPTPEPTQTITPRPSPEAPTATPTQTLAPANPRPPTPDPRPLVLLVGLASVLGFVVWRRLAAGRAHNGGRSRED